MTKESAPQDAAYMVKQAMNRLEANAHGSHVHIDEIKNPDLKALAEHATTGSGQRVSVARLKNVLKTIGAEIKSVDHKNQGGDGDGKLDFKEAANLSPMAMRMLDWALDGAEHAGEAEAVMFVKPKDVDEAARQALALIKTDLPRGRKPVKLADAKGNAFLENLIRGAAERIADEAPTERRRVSSGCGGSSYVNVRTVEPEDVLKKGVSRASLREIVNDARTYLKDDVTWADPRDGNANIDNQRWAVEDEMYSADSDYGAGTGNAAVGIFEMMKAEAEKGNMRPSDGDLADLNRPVSSGC